MRRDAFLAGLGATSAVFALGAAAAAPSRRTVRVRLFSGLRVTSAEFSSPAGLFNAPEDVVSTSRRIVVSSSDDKPYLISSPAPIEVTAHLDDGTVIDRTYDGSFAAGRVADYLTIVNTVDLESYVASVLNSEIAARWQPETLEAQAIAVRTYAVRRMSRPMSDYDVTDSTSNQVYKGALNVATSFVTATQATAGRLLWFEGVPADVWYHAVCGGHTAGSVEIAGQPGPTYLAGYPDVDAKGTSFCAWSPDYRWRNIISTADLSRVVAPSGSVASLSIAQTWPDGRVRTVVAETAEGSTQQIDGRAFYEHAGATLGYKVLPSTLFTVTGPTAGSFEFDGRGLGHGIGMCQWGAEGRARAGQSAEEILTAYFPGTSVS
jgi:stage II sporulation protein D